MAPFLRSWALEGSDDGVNWFELDKRSDVDAIDGNFKAATVIVTKPRHCRRIRVRQTGPSHNDPKYPPDFFALSALELFGEFIAGERKEIFDGLCTYAEHGEMYFVQPMWHCRTCGLLEGKVVCKNCVEKCHRGHNLEFAGELEGYCDCGPGGGRAPCKCMK
jgi:hypothetical protein